MELFATAPDLPYLPTLTRLALALALGLFIGLERERRGKEAGLRTFGFAGLLGGMGGLLGDGYALMGLGLLGILVVFLNWATLRDGQGLELTTSAARTKESDGRLADAAYRGVLLSTAAMALRNGILLAILGVGVLMSAVLPLALMFLLSLLLSWKSGGIGVRGEAPPMARLASPFSLQSALKFGVVFLLLQIAGTLGQRVLGDTGFYGVSVVAGLVSSASGVAAAATLAAHGTISVQAAGIGVVLNSVASTAVKLPLVVRISGHRRLAFKLGLALTTVMLVGIAATFVSPEPLVTLAATR